MNHHLRMGDAFGNSFVVYAQPHPFAALAMSVDFESLGSTVAAQTTCDVFYRNFSDGGQAWLERVLASSAGALGSNGR